MQNNIYAAKEMLKHLDILHCSACKGKGEVEIHYAGNTKISPPHMEKCNFCSGTGYKRYQIFNWFKDPKGDKYMYKNPKGIYKKEEL